jgi:hypothetical protein
MSDLPLPPRPPSRGPVRRRDRGMTEDEVMRDRSGLSPLAREPMMRETDPGYVVNGRQMSDPTYIESIRRMREEASKGMRMKKGGKVKKMASGGSVKSSYTRGDGCAIKGKTKGETV